MDFMNGDVISISNITSHGCGQTIFHLRIGTGIRFPHDYYTVMLEILQVGTFLYCKSVGNSGDK